MEVKPWLQGSVDGVAAMVRQRIVLFVCPHGAAKSRMAAAWFNGEAVPGWSATSAGVEPQATPSVHPARLLAGTPVQELLDGAVPRPMSEVPDADLTVAIDCDGDLAAAMSWRLTHQTFDEAMCAEIRDRVHTLAGGLPVADPP